MRNWHQALFSAEQGARQHFGYQNVYESTVD